MNRTCLFLLQVMMLLVFLIFVMSLLVLTLTTRSCSAQTQNISFKVYVEQLAFKPDIVFLQETYDLKENSSCWNLWPHTPHCSPARSRGSGVTSLINRAEIDVVTTTSIFDGYILYNELCYNNLIFHAYNVLIPQSDETAILAFTALNSHISKCRDGVIILGGDYIH